MREIETILGFRKSLYPQYLIFTIAVWEGLSPSYTGKTFYMQPCTQPYTQVIHAALPANSRPREWELPNQSTLLSTSGGRIQLGGDEGERTDIGLQLPDVPLAESDSMRYIP